MLGKQLLVLLITVSQVIFAQENTQPESKSTKEEGEKTFENGVIINNQTVQSSAKKSLDFIIQHRFGDIVNGKDLFGIFGPTNIRLGLEYGITDRLSLGAGATKNNSLYDLELKFEILKQGKSGEMPVSVSYFGDLTVKAGDNAHFFNQDGKYFAANRCYFFHELMVARKFNEHFSLQLGCSYTYLNLVIEPERRRSYTGLHTVASYKITPKSAIQMEYDWNLTPDKIPDEKDPAKKVTIQKPNLSLGYERSSGSYQFQMFVTTSNGIAGADVIADNTNDFTKKNNLLFGFNIIRQFEFN